jgi:hypothetical protein
MHHKREHSKSVCRLEIHLQMFLEAYNFNHLLLLTHPFHKIIFYNGYNHRVDRVLSYFAGRPNWDSLTRRRVCSPLLWLGGGGGGSHSLAGEGVPIRTRGKTLWTPGIQYTVLCALWDTNINYFGGEGGGGGLVGPRDQSVSP